MMWGVFGPGVVSFIGAALCCWVILATRSIHGKYSLDYDTKSVQKYHSVAVPRVGGAALFVGLMVGAVFHGLQGDDKLYLSKWAGIAALPVFLGGLLEDVFKKISARDRLLLAFLSAAIAYYELGIGLKAVGWEFFDTTILGQPGISLIITVFMVGGVAHSTNIIDGFHGLLIGFTLLVLAAFLWVLSIVNDYLLTIYTTILLGGLGGIVVFNFPKGKIFLGDGGAYLIGFLLAVLALLLVGRHPTISPWFPLAVMAYPVVETVFSIIRKTLVERRHAMVPDKKHLHMLVFQKMGPRVANRLHINQNAATAVVMWLVGLSSILPSLVFWNNTIACLLIFGIFSVGYTGLYLWLSSENELP